MAEDKKKLGLTTKIFIALLIGAVVGIIIHYYVPAGFVRDEVLINMTLFLLFDVVVVVVVVFVVVVVVAYLTLLLLLLFI